MREDWVEIELERISDSIQYGFTASSTKDPVGPKLLRITDIQDGKVNWSSVPHCKIAEKKLSDYLLKEGDLVFARTGATVGKSFLLGRNLPNAIFASYLIRVSVTEDLVENVYLSYFFNSPYYWQQVTENQAGIGQPNVNGSKLKRLNVPLPPLPEQRAIVSKIEQLFSELDHGIANLKAAKSKLETYRQAVLKKAFEGELTKEWRKNQNRYLNLAAEPLAEYKQVKQSEAKKSGNNDLPEGWYRVNVGEVINELTQGWSPKCHNFPANNHTEWAVIKTSSIQPSEFRQYENKVLPTELEPRVQHQLQKGDILITRAGPRVRVGVCCLVKEVRPRLLNCDKAYRIRLNEDVSPKFFELFMNSLEMIQKIEEIKTGGNDSGLNLTQTRFLKLDIVVPQIDEQTQIVQEIESRLSVCDKLSESIDQSLEQAIALRQSILKKAFAGRLLSEAEVEACKKEPDWEPAEKLLARIERSRNERVKNKVK